MKQTVLIPVELEPFTFLEDFSDYADLGFEPKASTVQYIHDFARNYRPL